MFSSSTGVFKLPSKMNAAKTATATIHQPKKAHQCEIECIQNGKLYHGPHNEFKLQPFLPYRISGVKKIVCQVNACNFGERLLMGLVMDHCIVLLLFSFDECGFFLLHSLELRAIFMRSFNIWCDVSTAFYFSSNHVS